MRIFYFINPVKQITDEDCAAPSQSSTPGSGFNTAYLGGLLAGT
jgi:hypothetical protein